MRHAILRANGSSPETRAETDWAARRLTSGPSADSHTRELRRRSRTRTRVGSTSSQTATRSRASSSASRNARAWPTAPSSGTSRSTQRRSFETFTTNGLRGTGTLARRIVAIDSIVRTQRDLHHRTHAAGSAPGRKHKRSMSAFDIAGYTPHQSGGHGMTYGRRSRDVSGRPAVGGDRHAIHRERQLLIAGVLAGGMAVFMAWMSWR